MSTAVVIVLAVVVLALIVVLLVMVGKRDGRGLDEASVRRLLTETRNEPLSGSPQATRDVSEPVDGPPRRAEPDQLAQTAAAELTRAASEAAEQLRTASRADADQVRAEARADADRLLSAARAEAADTRAQMGQERQRLVAEASEALSAEREDLAAVQQRLRAERAELDRERRELAKDRSGLHEDVEALARQQRSLAGAEQELDRRSGLLQHRTNELEQRAAQLDETAEQLAQQRALKTAELERVSGLTADQARIELLARQEDGARHDAAVLARRIEAEATANARTRGRAIVAEAIQRVAADQTAESVVSMVQLPADEVKGRIIGREGRNIRAFETITGVNVIIDDTPEAVLLSCFDPVRREVGRITLQMLIDDGRIHPHRIEEAYERAGDEVEDRCRRAAEDALIEVGITDLHPELVKLVGRLKYRTSYGQNVLGHLVETSHIARVMASELGIDPKITARGAFLHDIGKALTHEAQGSHAIVGADLARRFGESEAVAHCIEAHHDEVAPTTVEAVLTQAADACSGGRPGARRESLESYVQRLERIEAIASAKAGVEKVFAMQAGRELRVMVKPETVDDLEAHVIAREVAKQIEEELSYPGQVRVTVIRESRATEIAR